MLELIAKRFCEATKEDLEQTIIKKFAAIDVKVSLQSSKQILTYLNGSFQLLLNAFKLTSTFERWLAALFKDGHQVDKVATP